MFHSLPLIFFASLFLFSFQQQSVGAQAEEARDWKQCIIRMGDYFKPADRDTFSWSANDCGFKVMRPIDVRREIWFSGKLLNSDANTEELKDRKRSRKAVAYAGDSTGLRAFTQGVNMYAFPVEIKVIFKVAAVPARWPILTFEPPFAADQVDAGGKPLLSTDGVARTLANVTYYNMRYAYFAEGVVREEMRRVCEDPLSDGGYFFLTLGNWDLNWKTHKTEHVPGLTRKFDYPAAIQYWTHYVSRLFIAITEETEHCKLRRRKPPTIIIREQYMPNCAARRFSSSKHKKFKQCSSFLVPHVVPLYRRVLRGLGWAMQVPVIPTDHLFRDGYSFCGISDGLHLDPPCMPIEQQILWNSVNAIIKGSVSEGARRSREEGAADTHENGFTAQGWSVANAQQIQSAFAVADLASNPNAPSKDSISAGNYTSSIHSIASAMVDPLLYTVLMTALGLGGLYDGDSNPVNVIPPVNEGTVRPHITSLSSNNYAKSQMHSVLLTSNATAIAATSDEADENIIVEKFVSETVRARGVMERLVFTIGWDGLILVNVLGIGLVFLIVRELRNSK